MDNKLEPVEGETVTYRQNIDPRTGEMTLSSVPAEDVPKFNSVEEFHPESVPPEKRWPHWPNVCTCPHCCPEKWAANAAVRASTPLPVDQDLGFEVERIHGEDGVEVLIRDTDSPEWTSGVAWARSAPETVVTMLADAYEALKRKRNG